MATDPDPAAVAADDALVEDPRAGCQPPTDDQAAQAVAKIRSDPETMRLAAEVRARIRGGR